MIRTNKNWLLLFMIVILGLASCGGGPPKDIVLEGDLVASGAVNPNREGRASPVTVVIYHLKSADAFLAKDFFNLYDTESGALADDLLQRTDMQIQPGQTLSIASEFDPETTHIGVLVAFRDIDNADWRAVVPLPKKGLKDKINPFSKKRLLVNVNKLSVSAEVK